MLFVIIVVVVAIVVIFLDVVVVVKSTQLSYFPLNLAIIPVYLALHGMCDSKYFF